MVNPFKAPKPSQRCGGFLFLKDIYEYESKNNHKVRVII